jgi:4-methyl-5(b-hydroxyethyl)-thiazole monophosphate biosynthesis
MKSALIIITDGVEELETVAPLDILRRGGIHTTLCSAGSKLEVTGRNSIRLHCDCLLDKAPQHPDLIVIPGGPSHEAMLSDDRILERLRKHHADGKPLAAICAGPLVLKAAGVLAERRHTCHSSAAANLPDAETADVITDRGLVTSAGAGTAVAFGLALVELLEGKPARVAVADAIHYYDR